MGEVRKIILHDSEYKKHAIDLIWATPAGWEILIRPPTRTLEQNAKLHAVIGDIEKSGLIWGGKLRTFDEIKTLLVSGHAIATYDEFKIAPPKIVEGFESEAVSLRESTARMSKARSSSLISYAVAFCAQMGIKLWDKFGYGKKTTKIKEAA